MSGRARGASMAPEALRVAGLAEALDRRASTVLARGNLHGPLNPWSEPVEGYRHLAEVWPGTWPAFWSGRAGAVGRPGAVAARRRPCLAVARRCRRPPLPPPGPQAGGALARRPADFNTTPTDPVRNVHGKPVACLHGLPPGDAHHHLRRLADPAPRRAPSVSSARSTRWSRALGTSTASPSATCDTSTRVGITRPCRRRSPVDDDTHVHVSFDVDSSTRDRSGRGTPSPAAELPRGPSSA